MNQDPTGGWASRLAIARRDLLEFVRDRRALFITLVMPMAMYPLLALSSTLGLRTAILELDRRQESQQIDFAFSGPDAAGFAVRIGRLVERADRPADWPDTVTAQVVDRQEGQPLVDEGAADAWIDLPAGSLATLDGSGTLALEVRLSTTRPADRRVKESVLAVLRGVADDCRATRLHRAGLPASVLEPLRIGFAGNVPEGAAAAVRDILPAAVSAVLVLLALLTATGAFYPAIDAIAGEKERGTIETLLIAPCSPFDLVAGKFIAVFAVTLATLVANAISIGLTASVLGRFLPDGIAASLSPRDGIAVGLLILIAFAGLAAVAAAICLAVTAAAKSAKEAQNTLTPVVMLIAALAGSALLPGTESRRWLPAVPFAGQVAVARSLLDSVGWGNDTAAGVGDTPAATLPLALGLSVVSSAVITWLLLAATARLLANEEILFRGPEDATRGLQRPPSRGIPTVWQGCGALVAGFAALWYAQGLAPRDFVPALIVQQAMAVLVPLVAVSWWQRVDARRTFALGLPGGSWLRTGAAVVGAALLGGGAFVVGAAVALAVWQGRVSPEAVELAARLVDMIRGVPPAVAVLILAVMPAVCEELLFRGWVLSAFAGPQPTGRRALIAVVAQAAAFAAFHLLPERMPQTFALGLVLGGLVLATRSLLPAIVAHAAHNAMPVLLVATASSGDLAALGEGTAGLPPWAVAVAVGCLAIGGLLVAASLHGRQGYDAWMPDGGGARPR